MIGNRSKLLLVPFCALMVLVGCTNDPKMSEPLKPGDAYAGKKIYAHRCAPCHGETGKADTPIAKKLQVRDLSSPQWQQGATDEGIKKIVKEGKEKMPRFGRLKPQELEDIVAYVRSLGK